MSLIEAYTFALGQQRLEWEEAMISHTVRRSLYEVRVFKVETKICIQIYISIKTLIKIRSKFMGWEAVYVRTVKEAKALTLLKSTGLGAADCMAGLVNPGGEAQEKARLHAQVLNFSLF